MAKRILVVPDVHGRTFWKEPVSKYIGQADRIIFLGDYLDPYRDEGEEHTPESVYDNLMEIIQLKFDNMEKVILLKGNHDQHYSFRRFYDLACGNRCDKINWDKYHKAFNQNKDLFQLALGDCKRCSVCVLPCWFDRLLAQQGQLESMEAE